MAVEMQDELSLDYSKIFYKFCNCQILVLGWWNWYTCTIEVRMPYGLRVRVPSPANIRSLE